jgi:hypothetical protein
MHFNIYAACRRIYLVGLPAGDRRTPEQQVHRSCRGGVRCRGEGERAITGERERMGGRKVPLSCITAIRANEFKQI